MRIARAGRLAALIAAATAVACGPARDDGGTPDSSPAQAGPAVPPPAGATASAVQRPIAPDTALRGATASAAARKRGVKSPGDTSEYDRAIEYKPDPKKEIPAVGEKKP
jgi:hypothetical protein